MNAALVLGRALSAEGLKLRRTLTIAMVFIAPLFPVLLHVLIALTAGDRRPPEGYSWESTRRSTQFLWLFLMLPLYVSLQTALLGQLEHAPGTWKHLFALPVPRWSVYAAKFLVAVALLGASSLVLAVGMIAVGAGLRAIDPGFGFHGPLPWSDTLGDALITFLASWLIVALHGWVALRWQSVIVALGCGIVATVAGALISQSERWSRVYPWSFPVAAVGLNGPPSTSVVVVGVLGGIGVALVALWDLSRRDVL